MNVLKRFGQFPDKKRKDYFKTLSNYAKGQFQNQELTPALAEGESLLKVLLGFFKKYPETEPKTSIPNVKTNLKQLASDDDILVWFGHGSYFLQITGIKFLIDPVFSENASPLPGSVKAFPGSNVFTTDDIPEIDVLLISHDHWDHLDFQTLQKLKSKTDTVICGLGVAQHFEYWGWDTKRIVEKNWYDSIDLRKGCRLTLTPARHFSGRLFSRNISLWTSFVLETPTKKLFLGGDSGYGSHFKEIGKQFSPFDLAILECGQYNAKWPYIHSFPDEVVKEVKELRAKYLLPVHHSKFKLAQHPWYEPLEQLSKLAELEQIPMITPKIGEQVKLDDWDKVWDKWWKSLL